MGAELVSYHSHNTLELRYVVTFPPLAGPMSDGHCSRLKRLLLSHWLCEPPVVPELRVSSTCSTVVATFRYEGPSPYNVDDRFELQVWRRRAPPALACAESLTRARVSGPSYPARDCEGSWRRSGLGHPLRGPRPGVHTRQAAGCVLVTATGPRVEAWAQLTGTARS